MEEVWKDIPYLKGKYQISNLHNMRSWIDTHGNRRKEPKILKQRLNHNGYPTVKIHIDGKGKIEFVHRLMWLTWVGDIPKGYQINHINEIKTDNRLGNLNLMTPKQNINYGTANKRRSKTLSIIQRNDPKKSKSVIQKTLQWQIIRIWPSVREIERELGFNSSHIAECCRGERKTHKGFIWQYEDKAVS